MKVENLVGTRDFYPELQSELNIIFEAWRKVAISYGYEEIEGPLLESTDLWTLKSGAEIPEQMYSFVDKGGRSVAIRPELTPTVARMVAQKQKELLKPIKWFAIPRCLRYERPQKGRLREFFQFNLDCLGLDSMKADAEVISTAISIMEFFELDEKDFFIRISNRRLVQDLFLSVADKSQLKDISRLVDKFDKMKKEEFVLALEDLKVKDADKLIKILSLNNLDSIDFDSLSENGKKGYNELKELIMILGNYGFGKYVKIDFSIMRGFDYYTSTVFEVYDTSKKFRAIAGGGRYDDLVVDFGGEKCPGIGYGFGDVVFSLFLKEKGKLVSYKKNLDYFVITIGDVYETGLKIASKLRRKGFKVEIALAEMNTQKQLNYAGKLNVKSLVFVGEDELKKGKFKVKELASGKETFMSF